MAEDDRSAEINYPAWTDYRKKNGLDPLGMQNSSVSLYQTFLPGISNVTLRMRYYGLYAWLCRTFAKKDGDTNPESWKRFIRRAEALYALIAYRHGSEAGVAGIEWAQKVLDSADSEIVEFAAAAEPGSETYYLKQAWGAYGAAYRSQLFVIGIFDKSETHDLPIPSLEIGDRLAAVFEDSIGEAAAHFYDVIQRGMVTKAELDRLHGLTPSEIGLTGEERALYQDILLKPNEPSDPDAQSRRRSVLLILKIAGLLGRDPKPDEVRWTLFAGCDQKGRPLALGSPELEAQRQLWWVYHANDLCHIALETLLKFILDTLGEHPAGITLARLIPLCVDRILKAPEHAPVGWTAFLNSREPAANAYAADDADSEWSLCEDIIKRAGRSDERVCAPETAWSAIRLLAILHKRIRDEDRNIASVLGGFDPDAFRSLLTETRFLDLHADEPFSDMLMRLLEERVVQRHLWVALQKLRQGDYTFLIERDEGRLRLREKDGPVFTNPRLGPAITFLKDIHLVGGQGLSDYGAAAVSAS
ncbi:hypothetical protein RB623_19875 [Mesorhizobium sp. LHD-90]|uniref:hypothetical protein n=1 Tax=Mesorhizobium sp. LHD-90 TaxID=3071414 RepID=UPI0027DF1C8B|nr:hypothetical protein [Mesorhizobium sp. LHD-90]MDQ6436323.1 hypothetical protein [Mesorhizobium sp. LHD-90]